MNAEISEVKTEGWMGVFINNETPPDESYPMDVYEYSRDYTGKYVYSRLYRHIFIYKETMRYEIMRWETVHVKSHCEVALRSMIDSQKSVVEFLK